MAMETPTDGASEWLIACRMRSLTLSSALSWGMVWGYWGGVHSHGSAPKCMVYSGNSTLNAWFIVENPSMNLYMDDLGYPCFMKPPSAMVDIIPTPIAKAMVTCYLPPLRSGPCSKLRHECPGVNQHPHATAGFPPQHLLLTQGGPTTHRIKR